MDEAKEDAGSSVKVAVRGRPLNEAERAAAANDIVTFGEGDQLGEVTVAHPDGHTDRFAFDHAYHAHTDQRLVFNDLGRPLLDKAFHGYNGTIFAYGQTGSGKTHSSMEDGRECSMITHTHTHTHTNTHTHTHTYTIEPT
jgi:hypothetical protein